MRHVLIAALLSVSANSFAEVASFSNRDSLRSEKPLKCVQVEDVAAISSAADVAVGALSCVKKKRYEEAAALVLVASAFVDFDTRRVVDKSAHVARQTLFSEIFSGQSQEKMQGMFMAIKSLSPGNSRHAEICQHLQKIGPPSYFPKYIIAHGMAVFTNPEAPQLIEPFDAVAAWAASLREFTNCATPP